MKIKLTSLKKCILERVKITSVIQKIVLLTVKYIKFGAFFTVACHTV
jgi:hypothetical protein